MYDLEFNVGRSPITTSTSPDIVDYLLTKEPHTPTEDAVKKRFIDKTIALFYRQPEKIATILSFVGPDHPLHFLDAHGVSLNDVWLYHDGSTYHLVVMRLWDTEKGAAILWVCNPDKIMVESTGIPVLYPLGEISIPNTYKGLDIQTTLPDGKTQGPKTPKQAGVDFLDDLLEFDLTLNNPSRYKIQSMERFYQPLKDSLK